MAILDDLSGYEFEDLMEDVFRKLGYENVRQSRRTADEGRDILMEEVVDGRLRAVVVECKHTETVSRPVVQKLHSAVATYDYDGPKRGMVVTTGRFTAPAREYVGKVGAGSEGVSSHASQHRTRTRTRTRAIHDGGIELLDGSDLREIGEEIGMDLYNGRIEILCTQALRPTHPTGDRDAPVFEATRDIDNLEQAAVPTPVTAVEFEPMVTVSARTSATFETSVGVIHRLDETDDLVCHAAPGRPRVAGGEIRALVTTASTPRIDLEARERDLERTFDDVSLERFGQTETEYKEWAVDALRTRHTTTVHYTGGNNVDYEKTCEPGRSDVSVQAIDPVYLPHVRSRLVLGEYDYRYEYYAAGPSRSTTVNELHECVHCASKKEPHTYCGNCGSINCPTHTKTERLEGGPICTGCAVTERFALRRKYFTDEDALETFRREYSEMGIHEKAMENVPLAVGSVLGVLFVLLVIVSSVGLV